MPDVADQSFSARLDCHYLLLPPDSVDLRTVLVAVDHASYHVAQIITVRQLIGAWPPKSK